jgi:hypothetical protein
VRANHYDPCEACHEPRHALTTGLTLENAEILRRRRPVQLFSRQHCS